jgi:signal transduction histidine kinase
MLQHSRKTSAQKELTDINALCDEYLRLSYHGLRAKDKSFNAEFDTKFDTTLPLVSVIPQDIARVILNLINNAFYAVNARQKMEQQGDYKPQVTISTRKEGNQLVIEVSDNGTGMTEQVKEKVFQPFFTTKPTGEGTGLGLSLSYDIVTKGHGGELRVETKEGMGTEFIIQLPIV